MKKKSRSLVWILLSVFLLTGIAGCQKQGGTVTDATETESGQITTVDDISGKRIGVQLGTTGDIYASDYENDGSKTTVERYNKGFEAVQALTQDKIDAVVIDGEPAKVFVKENEGLKMLDEAFTEEDYAIAVAKGNDELLDKINTALGELKDSGELDKIVDKYITAE